MLKLIPNDWKYCNWVILAVDCCLAALNGFQYANFGPVIKETKEEFGINTFDVNTYNLMYPIMWLPFAPLSMVVVQKYGPTVGMSVAGVLNFLGTAVKILALYWMPGFWGLALAQGCAGAAEVFFLPLPALISGTWFSAERRSGATAIASMSNSIGIAIGYLVMPRIVHGSTAREGFLHIFVGQTILSLAVVLIIFTLPSAPAVPPSATAQKMAPLSELLPAMKSLLKDRSFMTLTIAMGLYTSVGWTTAGYLTELLQPFGVSEDNAGVMGSLFTLVGAGAQVLAGLLMNKSKMFKEPLQLGALGTMVSFLVLVVSVSISPDSYMVANVMGYICSIALGVAFVGSLPVIYELTCEITYPIAPSAAITMNMLISRFFSPPVNFGGSAIVTNDVTKSTSTHLMWTSTGLLVLVSCILFFVPKDYKRSRTESERSLLPSSRKIDNDGVDNDESTIEEEHDEKPLCSNEGSLQHNETYHAAVAVGMKKNTSYGAL